MTRCTECNGDGVCIEFRRFAGEYQAGEPIEVPCHECGGSGEYDDADETPMEAFNAAVERALAREQLTETVGDQLLKRRAA
jgi:hypothetical protein